MLLLAINLFNYIDRYVLAAVEPAIREHFFPGAKVVTEGSGREQLMAAMAKTGSLATAFLVSYMIAAPIFGWVANRMSRWLLVGLSVAVWSLATGASGLAMTFSMLLLTRCFVGVGEAGYGPSAPAIISELYPVEKRGQVLAWFYMAIPVGSALGYAVGGLVQSATGSWRWPFFVVVIPGMILAALCVFVKSPKRAAAGTPAGPAPDTAAGLQPAAAPAPRKKAGLKEYLAVLKIPSYLLDTAGMTAMTFAIGGFSYWMPAYLVDHVPGATLGSVNTIFGGIMVVCGITSTLLGGWLGDWYRKYNSGSYFIVSAIGIVISALFIVLMINTTFPLAWGWLFFAVFFLFLNTGPSNTILANVTSPTVRANAFALNILVIHALGDAISPPILGAIAGKSWGMALYLVAAVMVLAALFWFWGAAYLERDTQKAEAAA